MYVSKLEKSIGIEAYATSSPGIGGVIRQHIEDFKVEELLVDGSKAEINPKNLKRKVLGSSEKINHYLLCILVKRRWDNLLAVKAIAQQLNINSNRIDIAGIKDTRALTAQFITIEDISKEELEKLKVKELKLYPIGYIRNKISSYFLYGNSFHVKIRKITHSKSEIKKRLKHVLKELKEIGGTPNFFGHQRFGTRRPITHLVGKALIKGNFKKAAMLFLAEPGGYENPESRESRKFLKETLNFKQALKIFPKKLYYERLMLKHLSKKPKDFLGAFKRLPLKLRRLFPQAYQAYLFNKFLSNRIKRKVTLKKAEIGDYAVNVDLSGLPTPKNYKITNEKTFVEVNKAILAGKMFPAIPLIGFKQKLSQGIQGEIERQILEEENVSPENFKIKEMPEISLRGNLRTILTPIENFTINELSKDAANPSKNMVELTFQLQRGSYATVVLRELMKPRNLLTAGF
ncbi:tRNA pseudouridine(13) synthase TruD [Candidatus Bathyarchaeota archaeon]|nr:tRNA pseudouridine(13) synthase TruD [Candidatus Bathyarchaeota archaeon]